AVPRWLETAADARRAGARAGGAPGQGRAALRSASVRGARSRWGFFGPNSMGISMSGENRRVAGFSMLMTSRRADIARGLRAPVATARSTQRARNRWAAGGGVSVAPG